MAYVDGFLIPVPNARLDDYRALAELGAKVWRDHGALHYFEGVAEDVPEGKTTDFWRAVKREEGETVVFAFIVYESRASRDDVMAKAMADPRMQMDPSTMPFDGKRMVFGGFSELVAWMGESRPAG